MSSTTSNEVMVGCAVKITNIKLSGKIDGFSEGVLNDKNISDLKSARGRVAFRPKDLQRVYIFILGRNGNHINVTGLTSYDDISKVEDIFSRCCISEYQCEISSLTIDSMSFSCRRHIFSHFYRLLKCGNPTFIDSVTRVGWDIRMYPQFPGIVIRANGPTFTLFRSGCLTAVGFKSRVHFEGALETLVTL